MSLVEELGRECIIIHLLIFHLGGSPGGSDSKKSICNARDPGSIPGLGRCLEKEMATHSSILT